MNGMRCDFVKHPFLLRVFLFCFVTGFCFWPFLFQESFGMDCFVFFIMMMFSSAFHSKSTSIGSARFFNVPDLQCSECTLTV